MEGAKGTVTALSSLFSPEEAKRAAKHVEDAISEKKKELGQLEHFISDNNNLLKLVQRLPDELCHDIMVPFGKAAFFPGRLIHTNEFLVLLGEGYYAERTSKQTVEILQRRGKELDSQVDSLKAVMMDLKAEASFFDTAAIEAEEGLVEITENYNEELPSERMSNLGEQSKSDLLDSSEVADMNDANDDEEYARIMAKLDELEREELAAESVNEDNGYKATQAEFGCSISPDNFDKNLNVLKLEDIKNQRVPKGESLMENQFAEKFTVTDKHLLDPEPKEKVHTQVPSAAPNACADADKVSVQRIDEPSLRTRDVQSRAFTGSIVEHTHGFQTKPSGRTTTSSKSTESVQSKPVSRFKMQKGGR